MPLSTESQWGTVRHLEPQPGDEPHGIEQRLEWLPGPLIGRHLHDGFAIQFALVRGADRFRKLVPLNGEDSLMLPASLLGEAIQRHNGLLSEDAEFSSRFYRLLFQQRDRIQETLGRTFRTASSLKVASRGQLGGERDVLPDGLGAQDDQSDERWSVQQLIDIGKAQADLWGMPFPNPATAICCGLLMAAIDRPLYSGELSPSDLRAQMRLILFNADHDLMPDSQIEQYMERVVTRIVARLEDHINDNSDHFARYFFAETDGLVHEISKKAKEGGPIPRTICREVRLRLLLRSYDWMATSIHVGMRAVRECIANTLTLKELAIFDLMYRRQADLGGFPLILVRSHLKKIGIDPLIAPVSDVEPAAFLRLLQFYSDMVRKRRAADRRYKSSVPIENTPLTENAFQSNDAASGAVEFQERLDHTASLVAEFADLSCDCEDGGSFRLEDWDNSASMLDELSVECRVCGFRDDVDNSEQLQRFLQEHFPID